MKKNRGSAGVNILFGIVITALLIILIMQNSKANRKQEEKVNLTTEYHAVILDNNQVYFGKLKSPDAPYPVLTDVYYIQQQVNQQTKEVSNALIKRGNEWHKPDRMILNAEHILMIEPVSPDSQVAKLIEESKKAAENKK